MRTSEGTFIVVCTLSFVKNGRKKHLINSWSQFRYVNSKRPLEHILLVNGKFSYFKNEERKQKYNYC